MAHDSVEAGGCVLVFDADRLLTGWTASAGALVPGIAPLLVRGTPADRLWGELESVAGGRGPDIERLVLEGGGATWICHPRPPGANLGADLGANLGANPDADARALEAVVVEARAAAEQARRAKDRFLMVANHDLRQPLAALSLFVGALEARLQDPSVREILGAMTSALSAMKGLVDVHLDMARIDAGVLRPDPGSHAVNAMVTRMALEFAGQAEDKGIQLHVQPCSAMVRTDRDLLERILRNLLANAVRYTDRGRVLLGCRRRGDHLRMEVWDTGRGIPEAQIPLIFEEFWRAEQNPWGSAGQGGFGLGLAVVDRLARLLGHPVEVHSIEGRGSMFAVTVPLSAEEPDPPLLRLPVSPSPAARDEAGEPDDDEAWGGAEVLVIEDDGHVLEALRLLLGHWGCRVTAVPTVEMALDHVSRGASPELVVADFRLGGSASGIVAIRQVAKVMDRQVPGLILTGDTDPRRLREARLSGYPLLYKPVTAHALCGAVATLIGPHLR